MAAPTEEDREGQPTMESIFPDRSWGEGSDSLERPNWTTAAPAIPQWAPAGERYRENCPSFSRLPRSRSRSGESGRAR